MQDQSNSAQDLFEARDYVARLEEKIRLEEKKIRLEEEKNSLKAEMRV